MYKAKKFRHRQAESIDQQLNDYFKKHPDYKIISTTPILVPSNSFTTNSYMQYLLVVFEKPSGE